MKDESLFYLGAGPLGALLLGMALTPLRGLTPASNLSFAFMALTIVVAEFGGRWAATATALFSAVSLDFFLTQPYLRLSIEDKHDVIAFCGLAVCGLIAASLGSKRGERIATLRTVETHRDLLRSALREWHGDAPLAPQATRILAAAREAFPLAGIVLRDARGQTVASSDPADERRAEPDAGLDAETLLVRGPERSEPHAWDVPLPEAGGRIALVSGTQAVGCLDVWGSGAPASAEARRALADLSRLIAILLASRTRISSGDRPS
jgi:Domain of unknown function (DUF4118)